MKDLMEVGTVTPEVAKQLENTLSSEETSLFVGAHRVERQLSPMY